MESPKALPDCTHQPKFYWSFQNVIQDIVHVVAVPAIRPSVGLHNWDTSAVLTTLLHLTTWNITPHSADYRNPQTWSVLLLEADFDPPPFMSLFSYDPALHFTSYLFECSLHKEPLKDSFVSISGKRAKYRFLHDHMYWKLRSQTLNWTQIIALTSSW